MAGVGGTSDAVRMITVQKLEASARKVFRGQLTNSPPSSWNAWRGRRREREFIVLKTRFLCFSSGWCLSDGPSWDCDFPCLDRVMREGWKERQGMGEVLRAVKHSPCQNEDPASEPRNKQEQASSQVWMLESQSREVGSWDSLNTQSSAIGEPQVSVKDCVLKTKVGARKMAHQVQMLAGQT